MARGIILLLLVTPIVVVMALLSLSTRIEGSVVGERSNSFSLDSDSSSAKHKLQQGGKIFTPEAYAVTWAPPDQKLQGDVATHKSSFRPEAYVVTWGPPDQQLQGDVAAHKNTYTPEAYAVTWGPPDEQMKGDVATHKSTYTPEAYAVTWGPPDQRLQGDVDAHKSSFTPEAYAVTWGPPDHKLQGDIAAHKSSFRPEAYAVTWSPPDQQLQGDVAAHMRSFMPEAYAVTWGPPDQQLQGDIDAHKSSFTPESYAVTWGPPDQKLQGDVGAHKSSFRPEAYAVTWGPPDQQLQGAVDAHKSSFTPEAYAVTWSPPDQQSHGEGVARQDSLEPEAHRVIWKQPTQAPDAAAEATPAARGHGLHVEPGMLFTRKSMLPGTVLPEGTKFGGGGGFSDPQRFVVRSEADAIPFSYSQLDTILRMFRIPPGSKKAEQVAATLRTCEADVSPDPHTCATSEQAATDFAAASLGVRASELVAVVTVVHGRKDAARYVVAPDGVARIGKAAAVPCHPMAYPYMVHYCHRPTDVEALRVELAGLGDGATAIAMCHANTTSWDGRYFEMLNATRGEEICHFMPRNYVLWLPAADL